MFEQWSITSFMNKPLSAIKRPRIKPVWKGVIKEDAVGNKRPLSNRVKTLASVLMSEIGRQFRRSERSPFFGRRERQVSNHEGGKIPRLRASLKTSTAID